MAQNKFNNSSSTLPISRKDYMIYQSVLERKVLDKLLETHVGKCWKWIHMRNKQFGGLIWEQGLHWISRNHNSDARNSMWALANHARSIFLTNTCPPIAIVVVVWAIASRSALSGSKWGTHMIHSRCPRPVAQSRDQPTNQPTTPQNPLNKSKKPTPLGEATIGTTPSFTQ